MAPHNPLGHKLRYFEPPEDGVVGGHDPSDSEGDEEADSDSEGDSDAEGGVEREGTRARLEVGNPKP